MIFLEIPFTSLFAHPLLRVFPFIKLHHNLCDINHEYTYVYLFCIGMLEHYVTTLLHTSWYHFITIKHCPYIVHLSNPGVHVCLHYFILLLW